jgi:hypothetical protein
MSENYSKRVRVVAIGLGKGLVVIVNMKGFGFRQLY